MQFSIITPTFNRRELVARSIESSLSFARAVGQTEIVVIDDASSDGTQGMIRDRYGSEIANDRLVLIARERNGGTAVAKNDGIRAARGKWLIFLDSDDVLFPDAPTIISSFAAQHATAPLLFFRCRDEKGRLIGPPASPGPLDFPTLVVQGTPGECLGVASKEAMQSSLYDEDLPGFEIYAFIRIAQRFGPAMLSDGVVRSYRTIGADRITNASARLRRAAKMAHGFARMLDEFGSVMSFGTRLAVGTRVFAYTLAFVVGSGR